MITSENKKKNNVYDKEIKTAKESDPEGAAGEPATEINGFELGEDIPDEILDLVSGGCA